MKTKQIVSSIIGCFLFCGLSTASEAPVKWAENGHYYELISGVPSMSWEDARDWVAELSYTDASGQLYKGYLATITSAQESDFIEGLPFVQSSYLVGGYQTPTTDEATLAEKKSDWHWVTGEEWDYTNWRSGEPNNFFRWVGVTGAGRSEEYLQYFPGQPPPITMPYAGNTPAVWNDVYTGTFTDDDGEQFFGASSFIVEYELTSEPDPSIQEPGEWLIVSIEGTDVTADWSLMSEAQSYTLYYAYADYKGDVDMETLDSIHMGQVHSIFVANLPSGVTFYLAIIAHTDEGDVLSNIVKFMPFGGLVTYPETGELLMQLDDPNGIGSISMMGTRNTDGSDNFITKITGYDDAGEFTLHITDNKPMSYEREGSILKLIYQGDVIVGYELIETVLARIQKSAVSRISGIACDQFNSAEEYLLSVATQIDDKSIRTYKNIKELREMLIEPLSYIEALLYRKAINSSDFHRYMLTSPYDSHIEFLMNHPAFHKYQAIVNMKHLVTLSMPSLTKETEKTKQGYLDDYNEQCIDIPDPSPVTPTEIAMSKIDFDYECPAPPKGAIFIEFIHPSGLLSQYYAMNESDLVFKAVGARQSFEQNDEGIYFLLTTACNDINSRPLGWAFIYFENGEVFKASYYSGGEYIGYIFYADGMLQSLVESQDGRTTLYRSYLEDGALNECSGSGCIN